MRFTVAIDGPAAAGKGTISRGLAERFGFAHLDTGLLYRATGRKVLETGLAPEAAALAVGPEDLARDGLRTQAVAELASKVATIPEVRAALVAFQRDFARRDGGAVLDGRDIATVVFPNADKKFYIDADYSERVRRRFKELHLTDKGITEKDVESDLRNRDRIDSTREHAPLKKAIDAVCIDTTNMTIKEVVERVLSYVR